MADNDHTVRRRRRRRQGSEQSKWRRFDYVALTLTAIAVAWALALASILVARSGDTVDALLGALSGVQESRQQRTETRARLAAVAADRDRYRAEARRARTRAVREIAATREQARVALARAGLDGAQARAQNRIALAAVALARAEARRLDGAGDRRAVLDASLDRVSEAHARAVKAIERLEAAARRFPRDHAWRVATAAALTHLRAVRDHLAGEIAQLRARLPRQA